jgi:hypothetical protein
LRFLPTLVLRDCANRSVMAFVFVIRLPALACASTARSWRCSDVAQSPFSMCSIRASRSESASRSSGMLTGSPLGFWRCGVLMSAAFGPSPTFLPLLQFSRMLRRVLRRTRLEAQDRPTSCHPRADAPCSQLGRNTDPRSPVTRPRGPQRRKRSRLFGANSLFAREHRTSGSTPCSNSQWDRRFNRAFRISFRRERGQQSPAHRSLASLRSPRARGFGATRATFQRTARMGTSGTATASRGHRR